MNKVMIRNLIYATLFVLLVGCGTSYKPLHDSFGQSGTYDETKAKNYTNDLIICKKIAKDNTNKTIEAGKVGYNWLIRPQLLWLVDKAEYKERNIIKNCLVNRGHSILND